MTVLTVALMAAGLALLLATGVVVWVLGARMARAAGRRPAQGGSEGLIGHIGIVRRPLEPLGQVLVDGELWRARRSWVEEDEPPPREGDAVVVDQVRGLTLSVRRADVWEVEG